MSLKLLLVFAAEEECKKLNFMGDSLNVINWINGTQLCRIIRLDNILRSAREVLNSFDAYSYWHVYRENNREADKASKEGLQLAMGQWKIKEHMDGFIQEYFHRPFMEWSLHIFSTLYFYHCSYELSISMFLLHNHMVLH